MSGRIRTIKPELLDDEIVGELPDGAWRAFVSTWLLSDDYGNARANLKNLGARIFWASQDPHAKIRGALARLLDDGLITLYECREQLYVHVCGWHKHQRVDRPGKPRVPGPDDDDSSAIDSASLPESRETSRKPHESSRPARAGKTTTTTTTTTTLTSGCQNQPESAAVVFDHWVSERGKDPKRAKFTSQRRRKVEARLREGYTVEDLKAAIDGVARSKHHRGENADGKVWDDLELICRDGSHVEMLRDMPSAPRPAPPTPPAQQPLTPPDDVTDEELSTGSWRQRVRAQS